MRIIEREEEKCCIDCDILLAYTKDDILYSYYEFEDRHGEIDRTIFKYIKCPKCSRFIQVGSIDTNMTRGQFAEKYKGRILYT